MPREERSRVLGGLRTTVYDSEIRVDNVQHAVMAMLGIRARLAGGESSPLSRVEIDMEPLADGSSVTAH